MKDCAKPNNELEIIVSPSNTKITITLLCIPMLMAQSQSTYVLEFLDKTDITQQGNY